MTVEGRQKVRSRWSPFSEDRASKNGKERKRGIANNKQAEHPSAYTPLTTSSLGPCSFPPRTPTRNSSKRMRPSWFASHFCMIKANSAAERESWKQIDSKQTVQKKRKTEKSESTESGELHRFNAYPHFSESSDEFLLVDAVVSIKRVQHAELTGKTCKRKEIRKKRKSTGMISDTSKRTMQEKRKRKTR